MSRIKDRSAGSTNKISPRENPGGSYQDEPPKFSLQFIQASHCINKCEAEEQRDFVQAMYKRKDQSWKSLQSMPHEKLGFEPIKQGFKVSIPQCAAEKTLLAFRFSGQKAMIGFRERDVFYILWFDRDFSVYVHR